MLSLSMLLQNHYIYIYMRALQEHPAGTKNWSAFWPTGLRNAGSMWGTLCGQPMCSATQWVFRATNAYEIYSTLFRPLGNGTAQPLYRLLAIVAGQTCTHGVLKATALSERQCSSNVDSLQCAHRHSMLQSHVFRHKCYTDINGIKIPALVKARDFDCD